LGMVTNQDLENRRGHIQDNHKISCWRLRGRKVIIEEYKCCGDVVIEG